MNAQFQSNPDTYELANNLLQGALLDGGATYVRDAAGYWHKPTTGFAVGGRAPALKMGPTDEDFAEASRRVEAWIVSQPVIGEKFPAFGSWLDTAVHEIVFDAVDILTGLQEAIDLGTERGEKAIYCLASGEEYFLPDVIDDSDLQYTDNEPEVNDDFPMSVEYDGLWGASDFENDRSAAEQDAFEAEYFGTGG